jgi:tropomyosin
LESEGASSRADKAEAEVKHLQTELSRRENEVLNLTNKCTLMQEDLQRQEKRIDEAKIRQSQDDKESTMIESLQRTIGMLEHQVDEKERGRKEAVELYVSSFERAHF